MSEIQKNKAYRIVDSSKTDSGIEGYSVKGYAIRIMETEPQAGLGKAQIGDSGLWMAWQAELEKK